jgi:hypothetical protein
LYVFGRKTLFAKFAAIGLTDVDFDAEHVERIAFLLESRILVFPTHHIGEIEELQHAAFICFGRGGDGA